MSEKEFFSQIYQTPLKNSHLNIESIEKQEMDSSKSEKGEKLTEIKKQRSTIERSLQSLQNRVSLLEQEEKRAQKILDNTKKRTIEIIYSKNNFIERQKMNDEVKRLDQERLNSLKVENQIKKEVLKQSLVLSKVRQVQKVRSDADLMKTLKGHFKQHQMIMQEEINLRNIQSYQQIKYQEKLQYMKLRQFEEQKKKVAQIHYKKRINDELVKGLKIKDDYQQLEQKEQDLLKKLRMSQGLQKQAYSQMEKVIMLPCDYIYQTAMKTSYPSINQHSSQYQTERSKTAKRSISYHCRAKPAQQII